MRVLDLDFVAFCCGCAKMRWSIRALPNCLGMLVSRIAKHAFEILEPLLQEPIDGRTSHDDQTTVDSYAKEPNGIAPAFPHGGFATCWLQHLASHASPESFMSLSFAKGQARQARDWKLVSRSKVESVKSRNPSNAEQNLSTLTAAPWNSRVPVAVDSVNY